MEHKTTRKGDTQAKTKSGRYVEGVGRRKTSVARVRIVTATHAPKEGEHTETSSPFVTVNKKSLETYFPLPQHRKLILAPLVKADMLGAFVVTVSVTGGGVSSQAQAVRHGIARSLVKHDEQLRKKLKVFGFLTRDPRMVERKKYGLKKARKSPQWSKR